MIRRLALGALTLGSVLVVLFCLLGGRQAELGFAVLAFAFPALLMIVGATDRRGRLGSIAWPVGALLVVLEASLLGMLALSGDPGAAARLSHPLVAVALQVVGVAGLPLALIACGYALTFDAFGVAEDDLARLRDLAEPREPE